MNILVTGATGFLGQKLALRLTNLGHHVTGIGRNQAIGNHLSDQGVHFIPCALEDRQAVIEACENQDYVFHSGAFSSPWGAYEDFYQSNVEGTKHVIEGCQKAGVTRLIYVSTPSLYFHYDERTNVEESDDLPSTFVNNYAKTKYLAECEIDRAFKEGLPVITIRPRALFGPGDNAILPRLIRVCQEGALPKFGQANVQVDITYVENVVDALLLCMNSGDETLGQKYNITNGVSVPLYEVIEQVMNKLNQPVRYRHIPFSVGFFLARMMETYANWFQKGKEPLLTRYTVSVLSKTQTLSIEKAKRELGYTPRVSIEEGIEHFATWWKENTQHESNSLA